MLYYIVRPFARAAFFVYFRKVYLSHADRIPRDKPVILACNHPTGFMEPCLAATLLNRPLYFLVRGDFFVKPLYARLLRALHMLPIYRWQDGGYSKLKDNFHTFDACYRALQENRTIMIFVEGSTKYVKRLRPLQKGAARIALGTLDQYPEVEDVFIVPVGVTYTQADRFRSDVMIDFGEPLKARNYQNLPEGAAADAIGALTQDLEMQMHSQLVHIAHPKDETLVEYLLEIDRLDRPAPLFPPLSSDDGPLEREKRIADFVNQMSGQEKEELQQRTFSYFDHLARLGLEDRYLKPAPALSLAERLFLVLGLIPSLLGYLLNFLPLWTARRLADMKVSHIEFYSPVMVASGIGFYLVYFLLLVISALALWSWKGLATAMAVPLLGVLSLWYMDLLERWRTGRVILSLADAQVAPLREERRELKAQFQPEKPA